MHLQRKALEEMPLETQIFGYIEWMPDLRTTSCLVSFPSFIAESFVFPSNANIYTNSAPCGIDSLYSSTSTVLRQKPKVFEAPTQKI